MARRGESVVVRQTLAGSDYGLLDEQGLQPNPSYWASWLWRSFMGDRVIDVTSTPSHAAVRAYASCLRNGEAAQRAESGAVALVLENLDPAQTVTVDLPAAAASGAGLLRFGAGRLDDRQVRAGGEVLEASSDGKPPALPALESVAPDSKLELAPQSVSFVVLPRAAAPACLAAN
jgi:hypothetical protein